MSEIDDAFDAIDADWWRAQEEADARHESEFGPEFVSKPWIPEWRRRRDYLTFGMDEKSGAATNEPQENRY